MHRGFTSADELKRAEEDGVPDTNALSLRSPQVLPDSMSRVANLLKFRLCRGCQAPES